MKDYKECPKCADRSHTRRRVCRGCGFEFYPRKVAQNSPKETPQTVSATPVHVAELPAIIEKSISDFLHGINHHRAAILYHENRILRKQIAIEEIISGNLCADIT